MSGSFESVRWYACVHRLDLGLYSHPKEFWGNGIRTHVNSKGKVPSTGKILHRGGSNPQRCIKQRIEPNTLPTSHFCPLTQRYIIILPEHEAANKPQQSQKNSYRDYKDPTWSDCAATRVYNHRKTPVEATKILPGLTVQPPESTITEKHLKRLQRPYLVCLCSH